MGLDTALAPLFFILFLSFFSLLLAFCFLFLIIHFLGQASCLHLLRLLRMPLDEATTLPLGCIQRFRGP